jgi:hypothetical protein
MANLKPKSDKFISLNGEMEPGGAPIYADDIIRVQENDQADILNYFEANRRLLPELLTWDGASNVKQFENGLILSGLEYDNTDPANPVVSEGYFLSGGEVCYYPGGTIATGLTNRGLLYLFKGAEVKTSRVFSVGGSKDILVTHDTTVEVGQVTANGLELQAGTAITATDDVVVLGIGIPGTAPVFYGEDYFTFRTANKVTELGNKLNEEDFIAAALKPTVTHAGSLPYLVSRILSDGRTEVLGSAVIPAALQITPFIDVATLGSHNVTSTGTIPLSAVTDEYAISVFVTSSGLIKLLEPPGGWPGVQFTVYIDSRVYGAGTIPTPYKYVNNFLDIT